MEANEQGKVFGAVTSQDISERLVTMGHAVDKKKIGTKPIKDEGEHEVTVSLGHGVQARLKVVVQINRPKIEEDEAPVKKKRPVKPKAEKSE
jgi:large subunit ribosomal protein L9